MNLVTPTLMPSLQPAVRLPRFVMDYTVSLSNFSGPLDLLLHLVREEEVEITEIPLAAVCDKYFAYLKTLQELDVEIAAEFLVVAATLMVIKSRALLPAEEEVDLDEELDPEDELIQQLLEYKRFKVASRDLEALALERTRVFPFRAERQGEEQEIPIEELDLWDLVKAFAQVLEATGLTKPHVPRLLKFEKSLREFIDEVFTVLRTRRRLAFRELFEAPPDRWTLVGRFLALLELIKRQRVQAVQGTSFESIDIVLVDEREYSVDEILAAEQDNLPVTPADDELERAENPDGEAAPIAASARTDVDAEAADEAVAFDAEFEAGRDDASETA